MCMYTRDRQEHICAPGIGKTKHASDNEVISM